MAIDKRLKNVQQADLTESRVNDDFVFMLRRFGPNVLIAVLLVVAGLMGWHWYNQRVERERDTAWMDLKQATVPAALLEVASQHPDKGALANFAELTAADTYMLSINRGVRFDRDASAPDKDITPEIRAEWLKEADRLYAKVADATKGATTLGSQMMHVSAIFGRAAVAEDRHDLPAAETFLKQIEEIVKSTESAALGEVAAERRERLQQISADIVFVAAATTAPSATPPTVPIGVGSPAPGAQPIKVGPDGKPLREGDGYYNEKGEWVYRTKGGTFTFTPTEADPNSLIIPGADNVDTHHLAVPQGDPKGQPAATPPAGTKPAQPTPAPEGSQPLQPRPSKAPAPAAPPASTPPASTPPASAPPASTPPASNP